MSQIYPQKRLLYNMLRHSYDGTPWHGSNLSDVLAGIDARTAVRRIQADTHNICELVIHLSRWREFAIRKLEGDADFDIVLGSAADWPVCHQADDHPWQAALEHLADTQQRLLALIADRTEEQLVQPVPGKNYNFLVLMHGIIHHDLYHGGQIGLLKKAFAGG